MHSIITETVRAAVRSSGSVIKSFRNQYCNTKQLLVFSNPMAANCLLRLQISCPRNSYLNRSFAPLTLIAIGEMCKLAGSASGLKPIPKKKKTTFKITDTCNGEKYPSHAPACRQLSCDFDLSMKNPMLIKYQHIPGDIHESTLPSRQLACFLSEAAQPPPSKIDRKIKPSIKVSLALSFSFSRSTSCSACNALGIRELVDPENLSRSI